jgi:hypothetical protein
MSYDVGMEVDTGAEYPQGVGEWHNYTYNVSPMFGAAFAQFGESGLRVLHGKAGEEAAPMIFAAMTYMREHMDEMRALNPPNGWGDADGAFAFLGGVLAQAHKHPKAVVGVR